MDTHKHFEENLVAYLMGELADQDRSALEAHLASCSHCAACLAEYRETLAATDAVPQIEPSPHFTQRVLLSARVARAHADREDAESGRECPPVPMAREVAAWPTRLALFAGKAAAVAAAVAIVMVITGKAIHEDAPPPSAEKPISMRLPSGGPNIMSAEPDFYPPDALQNTETQDIARLNVDVQPMDTVDVQAAPAPTMYPDTFDRLQVLRFESANPAYAARLDWRKKKESMRAAAADSRAAYAIIQGLWWLARHQDSDGKWDASAYTAHCAKERLCKDINLTPTLSNEGVTAAALLAMLGDGNTPSRGKFRQSVARGLEWLQGRQQANGGAIGVESPGDRHFLLAHAMATAALAEAYGMTGDPRYRIGAQKAVEFLAARDTAPPDAANIGGEAAALATARMVALNAADVARLDVPRQAIEQTAAALAKAATYPATAYAAPAPDASSSSHVSPAMLALMAPGSETNRALLLGEVGRLHSEPPDWKKNGQIHWLLGSVIMKKADADAYRHWYQALQQTLIRNQRESGHAIGSWVPKDSGSQLGGRVFSTALSILALEIPYR